MWKSLVPPPTRTARTSTMTRSRHHKPAPSSTPWDGQSPESISPAQAVVAAAHRGAYAFRHEAFDGDIDFFNGYAREACPWCAGRCVNRRGFDSSGMQRYLCRDCERSFTPTTGTVFEDRKLPLTAWADFLIQLFSFESMAVMTRENRRSDTTVPYWLAKVFAVLEGVQDNTVLSGRIQMDETYYPVPGAKVVRVEGKRLRGLSRNKMCIGIGCDNAGRSYYAYEGCGKTSSARTLAAFGGHMAPGSLLVHDMEKAHGKLVKRLGLADEQHNSKLLSGMPDKDNPLCDVNSLCYLVKRFLGSHSGFNRGDIDDYLNLFSVMMNPPAAKMEKAALVLDRAMLNPNSLRFRDFYNQKPCSDDEKLS